MRASAHLSLLVQGAVVWALFWLAGLPSYYQHYSQVALAVGCILLTVATSLAAQFVLLRGRPQTRLRRATWISFYYTVPFAMLDSLYCGVYLGHGFGFLFRYWYLTVFYLVPWLTFVPPRSCWGAAALANRPSSRPTPLQQSAPDHCIERTHNDGGTLARSI